MQHVLKEFCNYFLYCSTIFSLHFYTVFPAQNFLVDIQQEPQRYFICVVLQREHRSWFFRLQGVHCTLREERSRWINHLFLYPASTISYFFCKTDSECK